MPKTSLDVITYAYRDLGVAAEDIPLTSQQENIGKEILDALFAEYAVEGFTTLTDVEAIPDVAFLGVGQMLANELAGNRYGKARDEREWRAGLRRLRRLLFPDDYMPDDLDEDGTVSEGEAAVYRQAQFY